MSWTEVDKDMGNAIWIAHTPCGRFTIYIPQGEGDFQME